MTSPASDSREIVNRERQQAFQSGFSAGVAWLIMGAVLAAILSLVWVVAWDFAKLTGIDDDNFGVIVLVVAFALLWFWIYLMKSTKEKTVRNGWAQW